METNQIFKTPIHTITKKPNSTHLTRKIKSDMLLVVYHRYRIFITASRSRQAPRKDNQRFASQFPTNYFRYCSTSKRAVCRHRFCSRPLSLLIHVPNQIATCNIDSFPSTLSTIFFDTHRHYDYW